MPRTKVARFARKRVLYTNETFEQAHQAISDLPPGGQPLPVAGSTDQEALESDVLRLLLRGGDYRVFPFGVRRTLPSALSLCLEIGGERRAGELLAALLPTYEPEGEVGGIAGLRVRSRSASGIELHQPGRTCSVWLTGLPSSAWRRLEIQHLLYITGMGWKPCWRHPNWTDEERLWEAEWGSDAWTARFREGGWISSGLLRRIALFHTVATPQAISAWQALGPGTAHWKMELDHLPESGYRVDEMVSFLTDSDFGLPLSLRTERESSRDPEETSLRVRLSGRSGTGVLEMLYCRFDHRLQEKDPQLYEAVMARINTAERRSCQ